MKITNDQTKQLTAEFSNELNALLLDIRDKAVKQFEYNLTVNIPRDILASGEVVEQAIECGLVASWSKRNEWSIEPSIKLAHHILEDVNAHDEAAVLAKFLTA